MRSDVSKAVLARLHRRSADCPMSPRCRLHLTPEAPKEKGLVGGCSGHAARTKISQTGTQGSESEAGRPKKAHALKLLLDRGAVAA